MKHVTTGIATWTLASLFASVASAAIPTDAKDEARLSNLEGAGPEHLQPSGSGFHSRYGCVAEFQSTYSLAAFPPEQHWCLLEKEGEYSIRSWRGSEARPGVRDNPSTPEDESTPDVPYTEQDVRVRSIPTAAGKDIRVLWLRAVLESRYPPTDYTGFDGATYRFMTTRYAFGGYLAAEVWSPSLDTPPRWMAEVGQSIYEVASSDRPFDDQLASEVAATRRKVEAFYDVRQTRQPVPLFIGLVLAGMALGAGMAVLLKRR